MMELTSPFPPHQRTLLHPLKPFPTLPSSYNLSLHNLRTNPPHHRHVINNHHSSNTLPTPTKPIRHPPRPPTTATSSPATTSDILRLMDGLSVTVPLELYTSLVGECTAAKDPAGAGNLFRHVIRSGVRPGLPFINRLLLMLVVCGLVDDARYVFDKMRVRDSNSWAIVIAGYMDNGSYEQVINLFLRMNYRLRCENHDTYKLPFLWIVVCVLRACVETENLGLGKQVHALVIKLGYNEDLFLSSSLMNFYGNLGCLKDLDRVFDNLANRNTTIWTNKLVNSCRQDQFKEAIDVFKEMGREGIRKNEFTFSSVLRACGRIDDNGLCGRQVHANLIKLGLESHEFIQCGVVDMYAKCGFVDYAKKVFQMIGDERTVACWNAMLTGYVQHGYSIEALKVLYAMKSIGIQPQDSLISEVRFSCGSKAL